MMLQNLDVYSMKKLYFKGLEKTNNFVKQQVATELKNLLRSTGWPEHIDISTQTNKRMWIKVAFTLHYVSS